MKGRAFSAKHRLQTLKTVVRSQSAIYTAVKSASWEIHVQCIHCRTQCFLCARSQGYAGTSQKKQWTYLELYVTERRSVTSHYHLSKISGSQQLFLTDRTICIIEQWMKSMGYGFVPAAVMYRNVIHVIFFTICRTTFA